MGNLQSEGKRVRVLGGKGRKSPKKDAASKAANIASYEAKSRESGGGVDGQKYLVTDSWRQVCRLELGEEELSLPSKESSSGESVFQDPQGHEIQAPDLEEEDSNTMADSDGSSTLVSLEQTLDPSQIVMKEVPGTKFTIVRHRKVDLGATRISDPSLTDILSGKQTTNKLVLLRLRHAKNSVRD